MTKRVLDPCCSIRAMWYDKADPRTHFADCRSGRLNMDQYPSQKGRSDKVVAPDQIHDFTDMPYDDESFYHVVFDPPHVKNSALNMETSITGFVYGALDPDTWKETLSKGFSECFRVLKPNGTLIFKWSERSIQLHEVLKLTDQKPLYGHKSAKRMGTHWIAFIKDPG